MLGILLVGLCALLLAAAVTARTLNVIEAGIAMFIIVTLLTTMAWKADPGDMTKLAFLGTWLGYMTVAAIVGALIGYAIARASPKIHRVRTD